MERGKERASKRKVEREQEGGKEPDPSRLREGHKLCLSLCWLTNCVSPRALLQSKVDGLVHALQVESGKQLTKLAVETAGRNSTSSPPSRLPLNPLPHPPHPNPIILTHSP